ncbi:MAG TPA: hypothetical protein VF140_03030, partial [Phycicoccus sp.]
SWTQQWTTLRNVAVLLEEDHPETALDILLGAAADPLSPSAVVGPAAEEEEALRRRLLARVPEAASRPRRTRVEVAEDARQTLLRVARSG